MEETDNVMPWNIHEDRLAIGCPNGEEKIWFVCDDTIRLLGALRRESHYDSAVSMHLPQRCNLVCPCACGNIGIGVDIVLFV